MNCKLLALAALVGLLIVGSGPARAQPDADACAPSGGLEFLCGAPNAEDVVEVPGAHMLIASGGVGAGAPVGRLYALDLRARISVAIIPDMSGRPLRQYAACPGPLDLAKFNPHGIALRPGPSRRSLLYVVNHGGRESIEMFVVDASGPSLRLRWAGCVVLPEGASGNGVAPLKDGGFVATRFYDKRQGGFMAQFAANKPTGGVYRWRPGAGLSEMAGGKAVGDNGLEVTADGKWLFVCLWPERRMLRLSLDGAKPPMSIPMPFMPDNIRRMADGSMLVGGARADVATLTACTKDYCPSPWAIARFDPASLKVTVLLTGEGTPGFGGPTGAVEADGKLWISTYRGDRIGIAPAQ
jgi:hypothetical protein